MKKQIGYTLKPEYYYQEKPICEMLIHDGSGWNI